MKLVLGALLMVISGLFCCGAAAQIPGFFHLKPPIANADPSILHQITVLVPTRLKVKRTADMLTAVVDTNSFESTNLMVGTNMVTGARGEWFVYPEGEPRPTNCYGGSELGTIDLYSHLGANIWNTKRDGFPVPGKKYIVEADIALFETDIPSQHMWSPSSKKYRILWRRIFKEVVE